MDGLTYRCSSQDSRFGPIDGFCTATARTDETSNGIEADASPTHTRPEATPLTASPSPKSASVIIDVFATSMLSTGRLRSSGIPANDAADTTPAATNAAANFVCGRTEEAFM